MSGTFKAKATDIQALADFLTSASEASRETGVWFCVYGATEVVIPGGSIARVGVVGQGEDQEYAIDDRIGN